MDIAIILTKYSKTRENSMEFGICDRKVIAGNSTEGKRLLEYNEEWKDILLKLKKAGVYGEPKYDSLMLGNFSAAIVKWIEPRESRKAWINIRDKKENYEVRYTVIPGFYTRKHYKENEKVMFACSRISTENKKSTFNHKISKNIYDNLIIINKESCEFNHINVDEFRSIGLGHSRHNDSEAKILEHIHDFVKEKKIEEFSVHLFSQLEPCLSCDYVIINFLEEFPKSKMYLYYEKEYNKLIIKEE